MVAAPDKQFASLEDSSKLFSTYRYILILWILLYGKSLGILQYSCIIGHGFSPLVAAAWWGLTHIDLKGGCVFLGTWPS